MRKNIGLKAESASELDSDVLRKLGLVVSVDFEPVKNRLLVDFPNHTKQELDEMEIEVKRFLALALFEPNPGHRIVVSEKIDALWHYFILHTQEYRNFCQEVYGSYLNHVPILPHKKKELGADYAKTRKLYAVYFGKPPKRLWGDAQQICWGGCDECLPTKRVNTVNAVYA